MTEQQGQYVRRAYITPSMLEGLVGGLPNGCRIRALFAQEDRQAFCLLLDMPNEEQWLVPEGDVIPALPLVETTVITEFGEFTRLEMGGGKDASNGDGRAHRKPSRKRR